MMKKAFTLGEILTTLMVVGIIAAMTMPILYNSLDSTKYMVALKNTHASYSINISQILAGATLCRCTGGIKSVSQVCTDGQPSVCAQGTICDTLSCLRAWGVTGKTFHNGALASAANFNYSECASCIKNDDAALPEAMKKRDFTVYELPTGVYSAIYDYESNCKENIGGDFKACGIVMFDLNGKKGPNRPCADRYAFYIADKPFSLNNPDGTPLVRTFLVPFGYKKDYKANIFNCTARVVYNRWKI